jgi:hypothetical protein
MSHTLAAAARAWLLLVQLLRISCRTPPRRRNDNKSPRVSATAKVVEGVVVAHSVESLCDCSCLGNILAVVRASGRSTACRRTGFQTLRRRLAFAQHLDVTWNSDMVGSCCCILQQHVCWKGKNRVSLSKLKRYGDNAAERSAKAFALRSTEGTSS